MGERAHRLLTALLAVTCGVEGAFIYTHRSPRGTPLRDAPASWPARFAPVLPPTRFDEVFDDTFFERNGDPFGQLKDFRDRMNMLFEGAERQAFGAAWDAWAKSRLSGEDIQATVTETPKLVVVAFTVPGLSGPSLRVSVKEHRIRLAYEARKAEKLPTEKGTFHAESTLQFEKILPVPENAEPGTSRVVRDKDSVRIFFKRRAETAPPQRAG